MDFNLAILIAIIGGFSIFMYYVVKFAVFLGFIFARSVSWHRWNIYVEHDGSFLKWWNDERCASKFRKAMALVKSIFAMMPEMVNESEYSHGVSTWRDIGDWNARSFTPSRIVKSEVVIGALYVFGMGMVLWGFSAIAHYASF